MATCEHAEPKVARLCRNLLAADRLYRMRFTGRGIESELICDEACTADHVVDVCAACRDVAIKGDWIGFVGEPEVATASSPLRFEHAPVAPVPPLLAMAPLLGGDRAIFIALTGDGRIVRWDVDRGERSRLVTLPIHALDLAAPVVLHVSRNGRFAAVANRRGLRGVVVDLVLGGVLHTLTRDGNEEEHCDFSFAFFERAGRTLYVHASAWNRLDVVDAASGELLTPRTLGPEHDLDYYHCGLIVSPGQLRIADNGWVWHPVGIITTWSLDAWLDGNVWESEDGPSRTSLDIRTYAWDLPACWLDDTHLAVYGYGQDDQWLLPAACIHDVTTGALARWFPGPSGDFVFDRVLISIADPTAVWDVERGARLATVDRHLGCYHPTAKRFVTLPNDGVATASTLCGLDADAPWNRGAVRDLARAIAADRAFHELPVLGDALQLAGCTDAELLAHCHAPGEHGARCWAIDRLLP